MDMHKPQKKKPGGPHLVPKEKENAFPGTGRQPGLNRTSPMSAAADPRYREIVNVTTALRLAWSLLNDPAYDGERTSVADLRLMAVIDRGLSRMDEVLNSWDVVENEHAGTWNEHVERKRQA